MLLDSGALAATGPGALPSAWRDEPGGRERAARDPSARPHGTASGADTDLYVKPSVYGADFGADLSVQQDAILAATQEPLAASALQEPSGPPAWKTIRSFALIGPQDMVLPPAEQVSMAARAHATVVKIKASHLGLISHPDTVARLIERAAVTTPLTANLALAGPASGERWPLLAPSRSPAWRLNCGPFIPLNGTPPR